MKKFLIILIVLAVYFCSGNIFAQESVLSQKVSELADKLAFAVEGYVVGASGETVYINLGQASGIVEGIKFEVVRLDNEHPFKMGEKIIGYPETEVGQIEITKVRKEMSLAKITNKVTDIQEGDKVYQEMKKVTRIAITEFTYGNEFNDFTKNVQDMLYTNLIQRGMTVVEREKMEQVLNELGKSFSGMIDSSTAAEIGKMLGVEAIVVGTVADMGNSVDLRARLVDVEKGAAITAAQIDVVKDPTITKIISNGKRKAIYGKAISDTIEEGKEVSIEKMPLDMSSTVFDNRWKATLISYQLMEDRSIRLNLLIENLQKTPAHCEFYPNDSDTYLLDNLSNKYFKPNHTVPEEGMELIQKMPVKVTVDFPKLKHEARAVVLYLKWRLWNVGGGSHWSNEQLYFGPIELK
jgi:TolB-like protein